MSIETIEEIRKYSKRPIIVRFHKVISDTQEQDFKILSKYIEDKQDITIFNQTNNNYPDIIPVIKNAYAVCIEKIIFFSNYNGCNFEGKLLYIKSKNCFFYNMNSDIKDIENPKIKDNRQEWFLNYAATHHSLKDLSLFKK